LIGYTSAIGEAAMTVIDQPIPVAVEPDEVGQRFQFADVDWQFYKQVSKQLDERHVFATYYKGSLEIVTVSLLHDRIVGLISLLVRMIAEETDTPLVGAGMTTLVRADLKEAVEPDSSFYLAHASKMRKKKQIRLPADPPPDLAIEVEVTRRLAARRQIFRDIGVPEIWVYRDGQIRVLVRAGNKYDEMDRSPTFPQIAPKQIAAFVLEGISADETSWAKSVRRRVHETISSSQQKD
jgi:Uma2 family endonuclease